MFLSGRNILRFTWCWPAVFGNRAIRPWLSRLRTKASPWDRDSPAAAELTQIAALSLARTGATVSALDLLNELMAKGQEDAETLSLVGRISKQKADAASDPDARNQALEQSLGFYEKAAGKGT